jgi:hypothetical protein
MPTTCESGLLQDAPQRVGYLLKDRVSDIGDFADAIRRIARGRVGDRPDPERIRQLDLVVLGG